MAVVDGDSHYSSLDYRDALTAAGLKTGDGVLIALPSGVGYLHAVAASLASGIRPILAQSSLPWSRLEELAVSLGARAVITTKRPPANLSGLSILNVRRHLEVRPSNFGELVLLTSGTSGANSGCLFSFDRLLQNATLHAHSINILPSDRLLAVVPLSSSFGFVAQALAAFVRGATLMVATAPFSPKGFLNVLATESITVTSLTPYLAGPVIEAARGHFPVSLRVLTIGGEHLPPAACETLLRARPDQELYLTYGLTEAGPRVSTLAAHAESSTRLTSVGRPLQGITTWLESHNEDGSGLLAVKTPTAALARLGEVDDRRATHIEPSNGIVRTGDVFSIDQDGYLHFVRRASDFILQGGEKICLSSIRRRAERLTSVRKTRTIIADDLLMPKRYRLVLYADDPGCGALQADIRAFLGQLRPSERPESVQCVPADSLDVFK